MALTTTPETGPAMPAGSAKRLAALILLAGAAFLGLISIFFIGFMGSDDSLYWTSASNWLAHFPYVGDSHWALRHPVVLPIAAARWLFGDGMFSLLLPTILYALALIATVAVWVRRACGLFAAAAATLLVITNPQFILESSVAGVDVPEIFFVVLSFLLLHAAMERGRTTPFPIWRLLLLSGMAAGLGMLCRETTVFAVAAVGLLFLAGFGMQRLYYFVMGLGFAAIVGAEFAALWALTGRMFYRATISVHHDATIDRWADQGLGVPQLHPLIDPVTMVLFNHNFGLTVWIGVPCCIWLLRRGQLTVPARRLVVMAAALAATWSVIAAGLWTLLPLTPRYFLLPSILLAMLAGVAIARMWQFGWRALPLLLAAAQVGSSLLATSLDNRNFMFGEHMLVEFAASEPGPIHTDFQTFRRARLLLIWKGLDDRVTAAPAKPGDVVLFNPGSSTPGAGPPPYTAVLATRGLPPTIGQRLVTALLPPGTIPPSLFEKLGRGAPDVTLYRQP